MDDRRKTKQAAGCRAATSKGAIWDEFREQHQHQNIKAPYLSPN